MYASGSHPPAAAPFAAEHGGVPLFLLHEGTEVQAHDERST
jgi:hypothetical protein